MTDAQMLVIAVSTVPLALVFANRMRLDVAALAMAAALGLAQLAGMSIFGPPHTPGSAVKAIAGFSQPVVLTLFSLFVLTGALEKSGVARWLASRMLEWGGDSERRLIVLFAGIAAILSIFMNNLAAGALVLPSAIDASRRTGVKSSKLLIPVAFGSLLGGVATYFTTANIIVSDLLVSASPPQKALNILDFTPVGGLIAIAGIAFLAVFGPRLLPDREPKVEQTLMRTASELAKHYGLAERLWELRVLPGSILEGKTLAASGIAERYGVAVAAIWRGEDAIFAPGAGEKLESGDLLLGVGREERVRQIQGVEIGRNQDAAELEGVMLVEAMVPPQSRSEGRSLRDLEFRKNYGFTGVAILRQQRSYRTDVAKMKLQAGDSLLLVGRPGRLELIRKLSGLVVFEPDLSGLAMERGPALASGGIMLAAIVASIAGAPVYLATLAGAVVLLLLGFYSAEEAYASMPWQALVSIAGMYSVSLAMVQTGLAAVIGDRVVAAVAPFGGMGLVAGAYLLTALLTQVIGGQVAALVTGPITIAAAIRLGQNPEAVAVATAIGCSAAFLTPFAHPVNLLVIGPGNYEFKDFVRIGLPLTFVCFVVLMAGMAVFWRL